MSVGMPQHDTQSDQPALVRFYLMPIEDKEASLKAGHYVAKNVEFVDVLVPFSKDKRTKKVDGWIQQIEANVLNGRMPKAWLDAYKQKLAAWRLGQEIPPDGTPIRGWPVISPALMETLIGLNILTVESLAAINDDGQRMIGMGSLDLKNKAIAWLSQRSDKGPLTIENAALKSKVGTLETTVETLNSQVEGLTKRLNQMQPPLVVVPAAPQPTISANDILPDGDDPDDSPE